MQFSTDFIIGADNGMESAVLHSPAGGWIQAVATEFAAGGSICRPDAEKPVPIPACVATILSADRLK